MGNSKFVGGLGNVFKKNKKKLTMLQAVAAASAPVVGAALAFFVAKPAQAAQQIWTGAGANSLTATGGNYLGGLTPLTGDTFLFGGTTRTTVTNNLGTAFNFGGISFNSGGTAFSISGTSSLLSGSIINLSTNTHTISFGSTMTAGAITFGNALAGGLTYSGVLSGTSGVIINSTGAGAVTFSNTNTFSGTMLISSGIFKLGSINALGANNATSTVTVASGATLDFSGFNSVNQTSKILNFSGTGAAGQLGALVNTGGSQVNNSLNLRMLGNATVGGAGRIEARGTWLDMQGNTLTVNSTGNGFFLTVGATVSNAGSIVVSSGAIFNLESTANMVGTATNIISLQNNSQMNLYQATGVSPWGIIANGTATISVTGYTATNQNIYNGSVALNGTNLRFNQGATNVVQLAGIVGGTGSISQAGAGMTVLSGANTFSGSALISAGALSFASFTSSSNLQLPGAIQVAAGGSLVYRPADASWTLANVGALATNATFLAGSMIGVDSTPGNVTFADDLGSLALPNVGFAKYGLNTVTLSTVQTVSGSSQVRMGTLILDTAPGVASLGTSNVTVDATTTLQLGNSNANGALGGNIVNNGTFIVRRTDNFSLTNNISGAGVTRFAGSNTITIGAGESISSTAAAAENVFGVGATLGDKSVAIVNGGSINLTAAYIGIGGGGQGTFVMNSGTVSSNSLRVGGVNSAGTGTAYITGGNLSTALDQNFGWGTTAQAPTGTLFQSGGNVTNGRTLNIGLGGGGTGVVNISGGTYNAVNLTSIGGQAGGGTGTLNINGGVFTSGQIQMGLNSTFNLNSGGTVRTVGFATTVAGINALNFNGGDLVATASSANFLGGSANIRALVFAGGFNLNSQGFALTISDSLRSAAGSGLTSVGFTATGDTFVTPPTIIFSGGSGTQAAGYASLDSLGNINGIVITNPGQYLTAPTTATIAGYTGTLTVGSTVANTAGGLNISGGGLVNLTGTNTNIGGSVIVNSGSALNLSFTNTLNIGNLGFVQVYPNATLGLVLQAGTNTTGFTAGNVTTVLTNGSFSNGSSLGLDTTQGNASYLTDLGATNPGLGLSKLGANSLTLGAANTFTGPVSIYGGTLIAPADGSLGAVPGSATAGLIFAGSGTYQFSNSYDINANRQVSIINNATVATVDTGSNTGSIGSFGTIGTNTTGFAKAGTGLLTLPGGSLGINGGAFSVNAGTLMATNGISIGLVSNTGGFNVASVAAGSANLILNNATVNAGIGIIGGLATTASSASGAVSQTGGSVTLTRFTLGATSTAIGTYDLIGGALTIGNSSTIGGSQGGAPGGVGSLYISGGGSLVSSPALSGQWVGLGNGAGSYGSLVINGGTFTPVTGANGFFLSNGGNTVVDLLDGTIDLLGSQFKLGFSNTTANTAIMNISPNGLLIGGSTNVSTYGGSNNNHIINLHGGTIRAGAANGVNFMAGGTSYVWPQMPDRLR